MEILTKELITKTYYIKDLLTCRNNNNNDSNCSNNNKYSGHFYELFFQEHIALSEKYTQKIKLIKPSDKKQLLN